MSVELVRYAPEFAPQVTELLTAFWPDRDMNRAYFTWLYEENPYGSAPVVYLLLDQGKVLGMRGFHAARWELAGSGTTFDAPCACMFVVAKESRGRGLAGLIMDGALADLQASGYRHVFSFSASPVPYLSQLRHRWRLAGNYRTVNRERRVSVRSITWTARKFHALERPAEVLLRRLAALGLAPFAKLDAVGVLPVARGKLSVSARPDAEAMAGIAASTSRHGAIRHLRDPAYFNWRYRNPLMDYRILSLHDPDLRGFVVLQARRRNPRTINIVDWEPAGGEILANMLRAICEHAGFKSLSVWSAAFAPEFAAVLGALGFAPIDETRGVPGYLPGLQIRALGDSPTGGVPPVLEDRLTDIHAWDLRPIFSDFF